jgi:hypothetical protein
MAGGGRASLGGSGVEAGASDGSDAASSEGLRWLERSAGASSFLPDSVRVDASHVFFNESNLDGFRILSAEKSSGATSDLAARGDNVQVGSLELDQGSFYTIDGNAVRWAPKAGGAEQRVELDVNVRTSTLLVDPTSIYVADHGCKNIRTISKADQTIRLTPISEVQGDEGGGTALAQDDEALFCSGAGFRVLVRMNKGDGQYSILATDEDVPYAATSSAGIDFAGVALSTDTIYWIVNQSGAAVGQALVRMPKAGGEVETLVELDVNGKNGVLEHDAARETLYWVSGRSRRASVLSYHVPSRALTVLAADRLARRGMAMDADHVYWSEDGGIMKLAKP